MHAASRPSREPAGAADFRTERAHELRQHLGHLDALRGWAVLAVISIHTGILMPNQFYPWLNNPGMRGVQLFFVVSAFTLLLSSQRRNRDSHPVLFFFLRRFFRLAPLCYLFIVYSYFAVPELHAFGLLHTLPSLLFLQNLSPTYYGAGANAGWSLGVEALFYLCFPLLLRCIRDLRSAVLWLAGTAVASTALWTTAAARMPAHAAYWSYYSFVVEAPVFLLGFVCFFVWRQFAPALAHTRNGTGDARWLSAALLLFAALIVVDVVPIDGSKTFFSSIFCAPLLLAVCLYQWPLLVNRFTIFLGKISYSMYLIHVALVTWAGHHLTGFLARSIFQTHRVLWWAATFVIVTALSAGLGTLTWLYVEEPGIRLGKRLIRWLEGRSTDGVPLFVPVEAAATTTSSPDAQF